MQKPASKRAPLNVRLDPDTKATIDGHAARVGVGVSALVEAIIRRKARSLCADPDVIRTAREVDAQRRKRAPDPK